MKVREEVQQIRAKGREREQKLRKAQEDLKKRKLEVEGEIKEIEVMLSQKLTLYFLKEFKSEAKISKEIEELKAKKEKGLEFLREDFDIIAKELEAMILRNNSEVRHLMEPKRRRVQTFDDLWTRLKENPRLCDRSKIEELLKMAAEIGELEETKAELEKLTP